MTLLRPTTPRVVGERNGGKSGEVCLVLSSCRLEKLKPRQRYNRYVRLVEKAKIRLQFSFVMVAKMGIIEVVWILPLKYLMMLIGIVLDVWLVQVSLALKREASILCENFKKKPINSRRATSRQKCGTTLF